MTQQRYPAGWNEARVKRVIDHYENMSEDELLAEDEAARESGESQWVVPTEPSRNGTRRPKKRKQPKGLKRKVKRAKS